MSWGREDSSSAAVPMGHCHRCGGVIYENLVHHCTTAVFTPPPPAWKTCPHCLGSGMVQADDTRDTTSPFS